MKPYFNFIPKSSPLESPNSAFLASSSTQVHKRFLQSWVKLFPLMAMLTISISLCISIFAVFQPNACGESRFEFEGYGIRSILVRKGDCIQSAQ